MRWMRLGTTLLFGVMLLPLGCTGGGDEATEEEAAEMEAKAEEMQHTGRFTPEDQQQDGDGQSESGNSDQ